MVGVRSSAAGDRVTEEEADQEADADTRVAESEVDDGALRILEPRYVNQEGGQGEQGGDDAEQRPGPRPVAGEQDLVRREEDILGAGSPAVVHRVLANLEPILEVSIHLEL